MKSLGMTFVAIIALGGCGLSSMPRHQESTDLVQSAGSQFTLEATIVRISVMSDNILFMVESDDQAVRKMIFSVPRKSNFEASLTAPDDIVILKYSPANTSPQPVSCFDNTDIGEALCL